MEKLTLTLATFLIFLLAACGDAASGDKVTVTVTGTANARDAASVEGSHIIARLEPGTELSGEWVETGSGPRDKWLKFDLNGRDAFVWTGNLSAKPRNSDSPSEIATGDSPSSSNDEKDYSWLIIAIPLVTILAIAGIIDFFSNKAAKKCHSCGQEWALVIVSSFDDPRSTFQKRSKASSNSQYATVNTYENGIRTELLQCKYCSHRVERRGNYKRLIDTHTERL